MSADGEHFTSNTKVLLGVKISMYYIVQKFCVDDLGVKIKNRKFTIIYLRGILLLIC